MIKATFENIGPIKNAELELDDLTIIAGQNNTGKTYLVYTLYGFLNILKERFPYSYFRKFVPAEEFAEKTENIVQQIKNTGQARVDIEEFEKINRWLIKRFSSFFSSDLINQVFSSPKGAFQGVHFSLEAEYGNSTMEDEIHVHSGKNRISIKSSLEEGEFIFEINNPDNTKFSSEFVIDGLSLLFWKIVQKSFPDPFILSAERFSISLFYKELDFTKNRLVEELQKLSDDKHFDLFSFLEKESSRYAQPIKDNIDFTRDLSRIQKKTSALPADKVRSVDRMIHGYYKVKNDEIRFISKKRGDNRFDIPLHLASSSVRGVSDLYFYLKHIARPGQILIIDEPESHLSPTNQIMMARLLVFCVNSGLKVLITTHSDYLIKEINNLIMLNSNFDGKSEFLEKNKKNYTKDDFLKPESVKAYICENGKLKKCSVDETGIDMPVFDNAIDNINKISNELALLTTLDDPRDD